MAIIHILPKLPNAVDAVGFYAVNAASIMFREHNIESRFITMLPAENRGGTFSFRSHALPSLDKTGLYNTLNRVIAETNSGRKLCIVIHYINYGFAKRGCPFWLIEGMELWKKGHAEARLVTFFHDIYADSILPWKSAFWLNMTQRTLGRRLAEISDKAVTTCPPFFESVRRWRGKDADVHLLPIPSTLPEPKEIIPVGKRARQLVLFGEQRRVIWSYPRIIRRVEKAAKLLGIREILDIGKPIINAPAKINSIPVIKKGELPDHDVSKIFSTVLAGYFHYSFDYLTKSTVFASYCANGIIPVLCVKTGWENPLARENTFLNIYGMSDNPSSSELINIQKNAAEWYKTHDMTAHSSLLASLSGLL